MEFYHKIRTLCRKAVTPITIMLIPHDYTRRTLNLNVPAIAIVISTFFSFVGLIYFCSLIPDAIRYRDVKQQLVDYSKKVSDFNSTLLSLKKEEKYLHALVSLGSKAKIMEKVDASGMGAFDINQVQQQIEYSLQTVGAIKDYLRTQKDLYLATPRGLPVAGPITSSYGGRINPINGHSEFHHGLDISASAGTPVTTTADGIVSFAGWNRGGGKLVVIAHGQGFFTYYAHNSKIIVEVGQRVKRGETVSYTGSTGSATGNHIHYEVWREGKARNPLNYMEEKS